MFPCSSIYQNFPRTNNQTMIRIFDDRSTIENGDNNSNNNNNNDDDRNYDQNHNVSSNDHHRDRDYPLIFEDDGVMLSHLLSQHQLLFTASNNGVTSRARDDGDGDDEEEDRRGKSKGSCSKRKTKRVAGKKDRHSKIYTAQGLRDRRMRLSLQIARKFFDLQDMLGFDKASRTIDWLFAKSKTAIKELKDSLLPHNSAASYDEFGAKTGAERSGDQGNKPGINDDDRRAKKATTTTRLRKPAVVVAKESRDKARARARERTREKFLERSRNVNPPSPSPRPRPNYNSNNVAFSAASSSSYSPQLHNIDHHQPEEGEFELDLKIMANDEYELGYYSSLLSEGRVGSGGRTNSDDDFLGFQADQTLDSIIINPHTSSTNDPCNAIIHERKPSSIVSIASSDSLPQNPSFFFEQNPNPFFMAASSELQDRNIFRSLGF